MKIVSRLLLVLGLACPAGPSAASMKIDIDFVADRASGHEWIQAHAEYDTNKTRLYEILNAIDEYPALHGWIRETRAGNDAGDGRQEYVIEFKFPWPVGARWSRIEVRREGDSVISWNQLEGSLGMNQGRVAISGQGRQARLDYQAVIDVGFPNALTRVYKKQFVSEFLHAIGQWTNHGSAVPDVAPDNASPLLAIYSDF